MPLTERLVMLACWSTLLAWLTGCAGVPRGRESLTSQRPGSGQSGDERPVEGQIIPAAYEEESPAEETELSLKSQRPTFPQQGWWCSEYEGWLAPERLERGYTLILPGIEGTSWFNISVARGLVDAGHEAAIEVNDWTTGYWPMFVYHLMALERNRVQAKQIADKIVAYQQHFPGRPVTLIGHSGGAAMSALVLEALPPGTKVTQAILLAGALSPDYDLSAALAHTERGVTNFYSGGDAFYLMLGTLALGTIDRRHSVSSGAVGFRTPAHLSAEQRRWYESMLRQEPYRLEMSRSFNLGGHFGPVNRNFVARWVAPLVRAENGERKADQGERGPEDG